MSLKSADLGDVQEGIGDGGKIVQSMIEEGLSTILLSVDNITCSPASLHCSSRYLSSSSNCRRKLCSSSKQSPIEIDGGVGTDIPIDAAASESRAEESSLPSLPVIHDRNDVYNYELADNPEDRRFNESVA